MEVIYTEDDVKSGNATINALYEVFKNQILTIGDDITIKPTKLYISFKRRNNFADFEFQKSKLKIHLNVPSGKLRDPKGLSHDVKRKGHWGSGDYEVWIERNEQLSDAMLLIRQAYERQSDVASSDTTTRLYSSNR